MANNCYNYITVSGDKKQLQGLKEKLSNHLLDEAKGKDGGMLDIYKLTNWKDGDVIYRLAGTKWFDVDLQLLEDDLIISGDSAWSPALELMQMLSREFNKLHFEHDYEEAGCDFGGWAEIHNGSIEDNPFSYWEYKFLRDYSLACEIAKDEIEYFISDNQEEELKDHDIKRYMREEDFNQILEEFLNI